jgi:hypothetical protein
MNFKIRSKLGAGYWLITAFQYAERRPSMNEIERLKSIDVNGAISKALRQQAERSSGCVMCDFSSGDVGPNFDSADEFFIMRTENGYMLCSDGLGVFRQTQITCCPHCGKRLEVEHGE